MGIQQLMRVPAGQRDLEWLKESLQSAIELEHSTIPPYLCAWWSVKHVKESHNKPNPTNTIKNWIGSIVFQEMLHMGIACNLLAAIGGVPNIYCAGFVPQYPTPLPGGVRPGLVVGLAGLAKDDATDDIKKKEVVQTFMQIEYPETPLARNESSGRGYSTIGEFYDAIVGAFEYLQPAISIDTQLATTLLDPPLKVIATVLDATDAITLIKDQGEGTGKTPLQTGNSGEVLDPEDLAHYYKFASIYHERLIAPDSSAKSGWSFSGDPLCFPPEDNLYLMAEVPRGGYCESAVVDTMYTKLLKLLHYAWSDGDAIKLTSAIGSMTALSGAAMSLLDSELPVGPSKGIIGPSFVFRP